MKVLDELKKQAKTIIKDYEQQSDKDESLQIMLASGVEDKLHEIYRYLTHITQQLRIVRPEIHTGLTIDELGYIEQLTQRSYRVFSELTYYQMTVGMTFMLECNKRCCLSNFSAKDKDRLANKLQHLGLDIMLDKKGQLEIEGKLSASLVVSTNQQHHTVVITTNNIGSTISQTYELQPKHITDELLNELGGLLLHKENKLHQLAKKLSDTTTVRLPDADDSEPTHTELMDFPLAHGLFRNRNQLYLTYREDIKEVGSRADGVVIGRSSNCDMTIDSDLASRKHARIVFRKGKFVVSDHSTNGTFVKSQGNKEIYLHGEDYPLTGSGFISLGESTTVDNEHLIYFTCH